ncbi:MAG: hypothetical protein QM831_10740 [Kofleriaceae bacterium]
MRTAALIALLLLGCIETKTSRCADGRLCPRDQVCDDTHGLCVYPDQLGCSTAGSTCEISEVAAGGECVDNVCIAQVCGDGLVTGDEACDGSGSVPGVGTCVDFSFDYGSLGCSSLCGAETSTCSRLGWNFVALSGAGNVAGFGETSDGTVWLATDNGMYSRNNDGTWHELGFVTDIPLQATGLSAVGDHVFVVGVDPRNGDGYVQMFDGAAWSSTKVAPGVFMHAIWARAANDVYAVGGLDTIVHYDGTSWTAVPHTADANREINAVWGDGSYVVAAGGSALAANKIFVYELTPTSATTQVLYDPNGGTVQGIIFSIGGIDPEHVWFGLDDGAVISRGADHFYTYTTPISNAGFRVTSIAARSPTEVYFAGDTHTGTVAANLYRFDGHTWSNEAMPFYDGLTAVFAGTHGMVAGATTQSIVESNGTGWASNAPVVASIEATSLWSDGLGYIAASTVGSSECIVEELHDGAWGAVPLTDASCTAICTKKPALEAIAGTSESDVYAVGPAGRIAHRSALGWKCTAVPADSTLLPPTFHDLWIAGPAEAWIVGADSVDATGRLFHVTTLSYTDQSAALPFTTPLRGIGGTSATDLFVVGKQGAIGHFDGTAWTQMTSPTTETLNDVYAAAPDDVFAVGTHGTVLHFDGNAWTVISFPAGRTTSTTGVDYTMVTGTSGTNVYAVGGRTLLHYDGTSWGPVGRPDAGGIEGVFAMPNDIYLAGENGVGVHLLGPLQ